MNLFDHLFNKNKTKTKPSKQKGNYMETWKLTVHGLVQGVGFRWSVQTFAQSLNINGTVKNNPDSTVTIMLQAPKAQVDSFIKQLPQNVSPWAKISKIDTKQLPGVEKMHDFHVLY